MKPHLPMKQSAIALSVLSAISIISLRAWHKNGKEKEAKSKEKKKKKKTKSGNYSVTGRSVS